MSSTIIPMDFAATASETPTFWLAVAEA